MALTPNLSLAISQSSSTFFSSYRGELDDNFAKIDTFAGLASSAISGAYGFSGSAILLSANWVASVYTLTVSGLGANDAIFIKGYGRTDRSAIAEADILESATAGVVTLEALTTPSIDISIVYYVERGGANNG